MIYCNGNMSQLDQWVMNPPPMSCRWRFWTRSATATEDGVSTSSTTELEGSLASTTNRSHRATETRDACGTTAHCRVVTPLASSTVTSRCAMPTRLRSVSGTTRSGCASESLFATSTRSSNVLRTLTALGMRSRTALRSHASTNPRTVV